MNLVSRKQYLSTIVSTVLFLPSVLYAQSTQTVIPLRAPLPLHSAVQDKNFYLLSLLERTPQVAKVVYKDPGLASIFNDRFKAVKKAEVDCRDNAGCTVNAALLTPDEIEQAQMSLEQLYDKNKALRDLVAGPIRQSGLFALYRNEDDRALLVHAWKDAAQGINRILEVYGKGVKPHYYLIDSASFDLNSVEYRDRLHRLVESLPNEKLFFLPSLRLALMLLELNRRDEAGRFEPMEQGENKSTIAHISGIHWSDYPYTAILALGWGPEDPNIPISLEGKTITLRAAELFRQGKAPLVIVSGGFVHPSQTRYAEAIEMRRLLIDEYRIPANAILIDPHARHTTTNFRNADRLIYRYGIPIDRPVLADVISVDRILT